MQCLTTEQIEIVARGASGTDSTDAFRNHILRCSRCLQRYEEVVANEQALCDLMQLGVRELIAEPESERATGQPEYVGPYRIVRRIGEGGMGVVYQAELVHQADERRPVRQTVALKVSQPGANSQQVLARFEAERQTLAQLSHETIAKFMYAGATETGQPYFAMEYVDGKPITEYADRAGLTIVERLRLFLEVCRGIQHAHQKAIIHRDIKPANVLVADDNGRSVPKIIDFGIAKAIDPDLTDRTLMTEAGRAPGTLEYMSPEQAGGGGSDHGGIDVRTDVYSLGVLLYEMLAGKRPFDRAQLQRSSIDAARRIIREQEPPKPSARLRDLAEDAKQITANRRTDIKSLQRQLQGDLDWIVMKALEKEPDRRYETVEAFAADIERHLHHQPVKAGPPSRTYRIRKFVRRNRVAVTGTSLTALLLAAMLAASASYAWQSREQERADWLAYVSSVHAAELALAYDDVDAGRRSLDLAPARLRDWEWRYLDAASDSSICEVPSHDDRPTLMFHVVATNSQVSISQYGPIRVWHGDNPPVEIQHRYRFASTPCFASASIDGSLIAAITKDGDASTIRFWDGGTLEEQPSLCVGERPASCVAVSPDGSLLALGLEGGSVEIWNRKTSTLDDVLGHHRSTCLAMAFSADGTHLASAAWNDMSICVWGLGTENGPPSRLESVFSRSRKPDVCVPQAEAINQETIRSFDGHSGGIAALAFSPDGTRLASASQDNTVRVWDLSGQGGNVVLLGHLDDVRSVAFSRNGAHLASGSEDGTIRIWDPTWERELAVLRGHRKLVWSVAYARGDHDLVSISQDGTLRRWGRPNLQGADLSPGSLYGDQVVIEHHRQSVSTIAFSPDGTLMASGSHENEVAIWDVGTWTLHTTVPTRDPDTRVVVFSPDGGTLAVAGHDAKIHLWEWKDGQEAETLVGHAGIVSSVDYNPAGTRLVSGSYDSTVRLWDPSTGDLLDTLDGHVGQPVRFVAFSEDGSYIVSYSDADPGSGGTADSDVGLICVWDGRKSHKQLWCGRVPRSNAGTGVGPRDAVAAIPSYLRHVRVCRALALAESVFSEGPSWIHLATSPDGSRIAVARHRGLISILNADTGEEMLRLRGHDGEAVRCVAFSPDGTLLASGGHDQNVYLWDTIPYRVRREQREAIQGLSEGGVPAAALGR